MRTLQADELAGMQAVAEETFFDEGYVLRREQEANDFGEMVDTYTPDDDAIACGFRPAGRVQRVGAELAVTEVDAILRVPLDTDIDLSCRVRITGRHGEAVTARDFDVFSEPRRGPSCLVIDLRRLEL